MSDQNPSCDFVSVRDSCLASHCDDSSPDLDVYKGFVSKGELSCVSGEMKVTQLSFSGILEFLNL